FEQRQKSKLHGRRIAARVADDTRALDLRAVDFRQPVDRFLEQIRAAMRHPVPLLEDRRVPEPEIGREVYDLHAGADELARLRQRDAVWGREEHDVARREGGLGWTDEREVVDAAQARKHLRDLRAGVFARGDRADFDVRMRGENAQKLDARVAGAAD